MMRTSTLITLLFVFIFNSYAFASNYKKHQNRVLKAVKIIGNTKTKPYIIINEMDVKVGKKLTEKDLRESLTRLLNLRIFTDVKLALKKVKGGSKLLVKVQERWTTIPIVKFNSGGGTTEFTAGAFDINLFGKYIEVGAQYQSLNGKPAGVTWFRNPRLFGKRIQAGYDIWFVNRNRSLFDSNVLEGEEARESAAFTINRRRANFFLTKEFVNWFLAGVGINYTNDEVNDEGLGDEAKAINAANPNFTLPGSAEQISTYFTLRLGRLNFDNYILDGFQSDWVFDFANKDILGNNSAVTITQTTKWFKRLKHKQNIGINFSTGFTDNKFLQKQFFVGGLNNVRGYVDGQFVGRNFWQANLEYRIPSYQSDWFVLQHNVFFDIGNVSDKFGDLFSSDENRQPFSSVGAGVRLISPKVFRLNLRIDVAQALNYNKALDISFGLQQFF